MTPDEIQTMRARAREYKEKTDVYVNGLRVPGGVRMPGADIANDLPRALDALEASRRECEELRAEVGRLQPGSFMCVPIDEEKAYISLAFLDEEEATS